MPALVQLPVGKSLKVRMAGDAFLDSLGNPNTVGNYVIGVGKAAERLGETRPLAAVADEEVGEVLELLWGDAAVNTWNARRAAVGSWMAWCRERGHDAPAIPAWTKRMPAPDSQTPARSKMAIDRLIAHRDVHLREKTLYRKLYETAARAEELLDVNIEDLGLFGRRCQVQGKGRCQGVSPRCAPRGLRAGGRPLGRGHRPAAASPAQGQHARAGRHHPPVPRARQGHRPARRMPRNRASPRWTPTPPPAGREPAGTFTTCVIPA